MSITIQRILELPLFTGASVASGQLGLHSPIDSVNVMVKLPHEQEEDGSAPAIPDISTWLGKNQMLFTTEHVIAGNGSLSLRFLQQMSCAECAGLVVKANHREANLPGDLLEASNRLGLPVIALPNDASLGEMMSQVLSIILNEKQVELERTFEIHRKFSRLFLNGASMSDVAQTLTGVIHHPILIQNNRRQIVGWSATARQRALSPAFQSELLQLSVHHAAAEGRLIYCVTESGEKLGIYPIHSSGMFKGSIIVMHADDTIDTSVMPLEQAAQIIAYESIKQDALMEGSNRLREEFFGELLENELSSVEEILKRGEKYGLTNKGQHWVVVSKPLAHTFEGHSTFQMEHAQLEHLMNEVHAYMEARNIQMIGTTKGEHVVLILTSLQETPPAGQEGEWIRLLEQLQEHMENGKDRWMIASGISNPADQLDRLPRAYQEASQALRHGLERNRGPFVSSYRVQQVPDLIRLLPYHKLSEFYVSVLKHLAYAKNEESLELLHTLDIYLQNNCNVKETATAMYLHRNTVFYRLNKCETMLGLSFKDPIDLLKLRMAVMIHQILTATEK
ncbi:PucR family transcriptional regulator [Paenibacillus soyae]|uniref:Helix-turn-helix domain-containing protein n=1 Tax=Paenibacillus soyae TaxID=2969249 RepID=A0A9X2MYB1_9BACL|nr:PucR family transcriptional regulator [Paenibacillus soyae]MCR2805692.1 helix-turn-helix domain-containing protein [Paenibacillus soyae]